MFTHCVINSTPSALRARPPRRGTVQVGFTEPLGRRPKAAALAKSQRERQRLHSTSSSALSPGQGEYPKGEGVKVNCYIVPKDKVFYFTWLYSTNSRGVFLPMECFMPSARM